MFSFSSTTAAPSAFGGFGAAAPGSASKAAAPAFGAAPVATGFGSFTSTSATAAPAPSTTSSFGGFGAANSTAASAAPSAAGTTATAGLGFGGGFSSTFGGFGSQPSGAGGAGVAAPAPSVSSFGAPTSNFFGAGSAVMPNANATNNALVFPLGADTPYKSLPSHVQSAFQEIYKDYKKPVHEILTSLTRADGKQFDVLVDSLRQSNLSALRLTNKFESLVARVNQLHEDMKEARKTSYDHLSAGLQEIKTLSFSRSENLFLWSVLESLRQKLFACASNIRHLSYQYTAASSQLTRDDRERGAYGQRVMIGPKQLVHLIQRQNDSLFTVAGALAEIHKDVEDLKRKFVSKFGDRGSRLFDFDGEAAGRSSSSSSNGRNGGGSGSASVDNERLLQKLRADVMESIRTSSSSSSSSSIVGLGGFGAPGQHQQQQQQSLQQPTASSFFGGATSSTAAASGANPFGMANPAAAGAPSTFGGPFITSNSSAGSINTSGGFGGFGTNAFAKPTVSSGGTLSALDLAQPLQGGAGGFMQQQQQFHPPPQQAGATTSQKKSNRSRR